MSDVRDEIARLSGMLLTELRAAWRERFNSPPPPYQSRVLLLHAFAYRLQARLSGGLTRATRSRLTGLAKQFEADPRYAPAPPEQLQPGTVLIRDWNGRRYGVTVTEAGFLFDGATHASLSKVAQVITGVKWSGPRFFKLADGAAPTQPTTP
jgi:hypothetical protein